MDERRRKRSRRHGAAACAALAFALSALLVPAGAVSAPDPGGETQLLVPVGKAIGVVFLVLQISGSGGTFPIECTPAFFRAIYRFLPFTYGINGMREAVGGIVWENLAVDIAVIAAYGIGFAAFGLILKRYANRALHKFSRQLEKTNVMGH